jgi:hypothetical protein
VCLGKCSRPVQIKFVYFGVNIIKAAGRNCSTSASCNNKKIQVIIYPNLYRDKLEDISFASRDEPIIYRDLFYVRHFFHLLQTNSSTLKFHEAAPIRLITEIKHLGELHRFELRRLTPHLFRQKTHRASLNNLHSRTPVRIIHFHQTRHHIYFPCFPQFFFTYRGLPHLPRSKTPEKNRLAQLPLSNSGRNKSRRVVIIVGGGTVPGINFS